LAVVIVKAPYVSEEKPLDHVGRYAATTLQEEGFQKNVREMVKGKKAAITFAPVDHFIATKDENKDPNTNLVLNK